MKLKYYSNNKILSLILISIVISCGIVQISSAATFSSIDVSPDAIFRCEGSTITATFTDYAGITNVYLLLGNKGQPRMSHGIPVYISEKYTMSYTDGVATYDYGNDENLVDGYKSISLEVVDTGVTTTYSSVAEINVYSDICSGTVTDYKNVSNGIDLPYTGQLMNSEIDIFTWSMTPYTSTIGSMFYFLLIIFLCIIVYFKSRNYLTKTSIGLLLYIRVLGTSMIPEQYKGIIFLLISIAIVVLLGLVFIKRGND